MNGDVDRDVYKKLAALAERADKVDVELENVQKLLHAVCTSKTVKKDIDDGASDCEGSDRRDSEVVEPRVLDGEGTCEGSLEPCDDEVRAASSVGEPEED
jgi:hypothetical protein